MYDRVLLPTDGSSGTERAVKHALAVAGPETTVHVLSVVDRRHIMAAAEEAKTGMRATLEEEADRALEEVRVRVEDAGIEAATAREEGVPHREIVDYADDNGIDLVVMGTHGRTGRDEVAALGSTTERVVENGSVPVLVVDIG
jgi:nucleotide-binding universal stress UspA family protein